MENPLVLIAMIAHGVGEPRHIQPWHGHTLAKMTGAEESIHLALVRVQPLVARKALTRQGQAVNR